MTSTTAAAGIGTTGTYPPPGRTLHLLDIENLLAGQICPGDVTRLWQAYTAWVKPAGHDHIVVAYGPTGAARSAFELPAQVATRIGAPGPDSADHVLLALIEDPAWVAARYTNVVIASADHIFANPAAALAHAAVPLAQVLGRCRHSYHLSLACQTTITLPLPDAASAAA